MRIRTAKRIANGEIGCKNKTQIEIKTKSFLESLGLVFEDGYLEEQFLIRWFCLDFAFPEHKVAIECQGDFFHINPKFYPNGPTCKIQQRNWGRDKRKKAYLEKCGWKFLEYWECDINAKTYEKELRKELEKLNII